MRPFSIAAMLCVVLAAPTAHAQVYKCTDERNQLVYQDKPCAAGQELRNFTSDPSTVSVVPGHTIGSTSTRRAAAQPPVKSRNTSAAERPAKTRGGDPAERRYIHPGMHEGEVVARIGAPDMKSGGGRKIARWTYLPSAGDPQTLTTVVLETGQVVEVERKVVR